MTAIPLELITFFGSSIFGAFMRMWGSSIKTRRMQHLMSLQALQVKARIVNDARHYDNRHFQWTRRLIALIAVFFIIVFPKIIAVVYPHLPIYIGYPELSQGFLFFTSSVSKIQWVQMTGLVITPLDTHLLSAIVGLYFGGALVGNN